MATGKAIALTRWTFVGKVMSLLFNMLSRLVITFLLRSNQSSFNFVAARISDQSILNEINPEYLLEGLMLKLKLQYCGHLMRRTDSSWQRPWCWKRLKAGGEGDDRGRDGWMASPSRWTWVWVDSGSWWWTGRPGMLWFMGSQRVGHDWVTELNWHTTIHKVDRQQDLLNSTGNYIQSLVKTYNERVCVTKSLYCVPEINTTL